jgi:microsomal dipeptidase-like Zn-dependent dipeptidase
VRLLGTHSNHRMLPPDRRAALHDAVARAIEAHGGTIEIAYVTELYLARPLAEAGELRAGEGVREPLPRMIVRHGARIDQGRPGT